MDNEDPRTEQVYSPLSESGLIEVIISVPFVNGLNLSLSLIILINKEK